MFGRGTEPVRRSVREPAAYWLSNWLPAVRLSQAGRQCSWLPSGESAHADVVGLRAKADGVDQSAVGGREGKLLTGVGELEIHVEIKLWHATNYVLAGFLIGPNEQVALGWDEVRAVGY